MKFQLFKQHTHFFSSKPLKWYLLLILGSFTILLNACSQISESDTDTDSQTSAVVEYSCIANPENDSKIYVILKNYHGNYWQKVIDGISTAAGESEASVYLGGIDNETDVSGQIALMNEAIREGADGILLAPTSSTELTESCLKARLSEIPVILIDSSISTRDFDACYMTDNMDAGKMAAKEMLKLLYEAGHSPSEALEIGISLSSDTSQAMVSRISGFLDYWTNYAPSQWEIAGDILQHGGNLKKAEAGASALLRKNERIQGFFGCNNTSSIGIANALLKGKRTDVVMVGFDLADETRQIIENPDYRAASLMQKQEQMGYLGILSLNALIKGEAPPQKYFDTGVILITSDYLRENSVS